MTLTNTLKPLTTIRQGESGIREIPTRYFSFSFDCSAFFRVKLAEASDQEVLRCAEKTGAFSFLNKPGEDVYSLSDGQPI